MKMIGLAKKTKSLALAFVAFGVLGVTGCGSVDDTTTSPDSGSGTTTGSSTTGSTTTASATESFTTTGENFIRYQITSLPATMTFNVQGVEMSDDVDMQPIVYFYDANGFSGGRGGRGFNGDLRNQKLKVYDTNDDLMGSEGERYGYDWDATDGSVPCSITWDASGVSINIGGVEARKEGSVASEFTIGIGVPPAIREGLIGITFTDVEWPAGATLVEQAL